MADDQGTVECIDGVASIALGDTLITLWQAPARTERIRHVTEVAQRLVAQTSGTIMACQFLLPSASPPRMQERAAIKAGMDVILPRARRLVTIPLGDAAWQSVVRGVMKAGLFLLGQSALVKVASGPVEAFEMLGQVATAQSPTREEMERALEALRASVTGEPRGR